MESFEIGMDLLKILPKFNMALAGDIGPQDIKDTAPIGIELLNLIKTKNINPGQLMFLLSTLLISVIKDAATDDTPEPTPEKFSLNDFKF